MSTCANTTLKRVLKLRRVRRSSVAEFCMGTSRILSRLTEITMMESCLTTYSSTEMELVKDKLKAFAKLKLYKLNKH
jgi:hypothetical protein